MSWERLPPAVTPMPQSTMTQLPTSSSPTNKRNGPVVGVLELKLKHRLMHEPNAVAIGALHRHHPSDRLDAQLATKHHKPPPQSSLKRAHRLPQLGPAVGVRPDSFDTERASVMDALALPSPTRSVVHQVVKATKARHRQQQAELPPVAGAFRKRRAPPSLFPRAYERNELPVLLESGGSGGSNTLRWTQSLAGVDFSTLFPLFLEGLTEPTHPYRVLARDGASQLLAFGTTHPEKLVACLPRVVLAVRQALETHESVSLRDALAVLQGLTSAPGVGPLLVPYYRQLLPVLNQFRNKRRNLGDAMDFQQRTARDVGDVILETLELLERTGGPDAFVNIKYMVPTYEGVL